MDGRIDLKECWVAMKNDVPNIHSEQLYTISSEFTVVVNKKKYDKFKDGHELDAVVRFGKDDDGGIKPRCVELDLAYLRKRKQQVADGNHQVAKEHINRLKAEVVLRAAQEERYRRFYNNQQELMVDITQMLVQLQEHRQIQMCKIGDLAKNVSNLEADWDMVATMAPPGYNAEARSDPIGPIKQMKIMLHHMMNLVGGDSIDREIPE